MGSSESKDNNNIRQKRSNNMTLPFPDTTSFSTLQKISEKLRMKQTVAMHGCDKEQYRNQQNAAAQERFNFWVCTVEEKGYFDLDKHSNNSNENQQQKGATGENNRSNSGKSSRTVPDTFLNCCGSDSEKGDIQFWMLKDHDKKYQVRPADEVETGDYVSDGKQIYGIKYSRKSIPPFLLAKMNELQSRQPEETTSAYSKDTFAMTQEAQDRIDLFSGSGIHPFENKIEEREYGVYGVRIVRDYSNKAKAVLAKLLKEIGEGAQISSGGDPSNNKR